MAEQKYRVRALAQDWVEIEHDGIDGTAKVSPTALAHWEKRGWRKAGAKDAAPVKNAPKTGQES